ncbi:MAG: chromosomal replication initiator protein DnaA [Chloroflexi bacterium]|nr:chromosomal replication initiator protein DnaA [Chloroflexota bacterium]|tara:strand:- start:10484 stop:11830 length:1347 start_codon:yes stop_codon:yes gene_type:complete
MTPDWIWKSALGRLEMKVAKASFDTFLRDTEGTSIESNILLVRASSSFAAEFLEQRLLHIIEEAVENVSNHKFSIKFHVGPINESIEFSDSNYDSHHTFRNNNYQNVKTPYSSELTLDYTLDSFAIGPSNEFAYSAISNAVNGDISFNPLLIYSDVGLGKTHLLLSARKKMISDGLNCLYITSEQFMRNFVNSVRNNDVESFRNRYEVLDSLLIDDVQFLSGKDQTQDIIYHIFNSMYQRGKLIVLTSNCHPSNLIAFNSNLKSRFEWGLVTNIQRPELNTAVEILRMKSHNKAVEIPDKVLQIIANEFSTNVRQLEGLLNRVIAFQKFNNKSIDETNVKSLLRDMIFTDRTSLTPEQVCRVVAKYYHTQNQAVVGRGGGKEVSRARNAAIYLLREDKHMSFKSIGNIFDGRDHSTVHSAWEKFSKEADSKDALVEISEIRRLLNNSN